MEQTRKEKFEKTIMFLEKCKTFSSALKNEDLSEKNISLLSKLEKWQCIEKYIEQDESIELSKEEKVSLFIAFHELIVEINQAEKMLKIMCEFVDNDKLKEETQNLSGCLDEILSIVNF